VRRSPVISNPYQTPSQAAQAQGMRPVRSLVFAGFGLATTAIAIAVPGAFLFNQEARFFPVESEVHDIHFGSVPISNAGAIAISWTLCFCLWSIAAGLWGIARRNHHLNQR